MEKNFVGGYEELRIVSRLAQKKLNKEFDRSEVGQAQIGYELRGKAARNSRGAIG